jgi:TolB-like protein
VDVKQIARELGIRYVVEAAFEEPAIAFASPRS